MPNDPADQAAPRFWQSVGAGAKNWPWSTRRTSTYDVALPDDCADDEYLGQLEHWLPLLFARHQPELVFFQAGVDALKQDKFGRWAQFQAARPGSHAYRWHHPGKPPHYGLHSGCLLTICTSLQMVSFRYHMFAASLALTAVKPPAPSCALALCGLQVVVEHNIFVGAEQFEHCS